MSGDREGGETHTHRSNEITLSNLLSQFKLVVVVVTIPFQFHCSAATCSPFTVNALRTRHNQPNGSVCVCVAECHCYCDDHSASATVPLPQFIKPKWLKFTLKCTARRCDGALLFLSYSLSLFPED